MKVLSAFLSLAAVALGQTDCFTDGGCPDAVYTMTNQSPNEVLGFQLNDQGAFNGIVSRSSLSPNNGGGNAAADPLFSAGAVITNSDGSRVYACNAGSDTVSVIQVLTGGGLFAGGTLTVGDFPQSVALSNDESVLYVLNHRGTAAANQAAGHTLTVIPLNEQRTAPSPTGISQTFPIAYGGGPNGNAAIGALPALDGVSDVSVLEDGRVVITQKMPSQILTFQSINGVLSQTFQTSNIQNAGADTIPFQIEGDPSNDNRVLVAEAAGNLGLFQTLAGAATFALVNRVSVMNFANPETCWAVFNDEGTRAFSSSTSSGTSTGFLSTVTVGELGLTNFVQNAATLNGDPTDLQYGDDTVYVLDAEVGMVFAYQANALGGLTIFPNVPANVAAGTSASLGAVAVTNSAGQTLAAGGLLPRGIQGLAISGDASGRSYFM